jgi:glycosyltransferase involved in cell wall biosynthesis
LRIAFVTPEFVTESYFSGGLANYVYRVSRALISLGHEVNVVLFSDSNKAELIHDGIRVHRLNSGPLRHWFNLFTRHRLPATSERLDFSFQVHRKLKELQKQNRFDVVQFPNYGACGLMSSLLLRVPHTTRISSYQPAWNELAGLNRSLDVKVTEWLEKLQLRLCRHLYAPSYYLQDLLQQETNTKNVRVIRTTFYVETANWDSSIYDETLKNKDYLLFFGRFQLHKGFHILAQALADFLQAHSDCYAVLVGLDASTSLASSMKEYALSLCAKGADRLIFLGQTRHQQLYPIIAGAKVVVLPSLIDNLPNACLEAMGLGKPVIGTMGTSFDEIITEGKTGFLVPAGDVEALVRKIAEAWSHPHLQEIGEAARGKVQSFAPEKTVPELLRYYRSIIDGASSGMLRQL